jgi:hypothetical protein
VFYVSGDVNFFLTMFEEFTHYLAERRNANEELIHENGLPLTIEPCEDVNISQFADGDRVHGAVTVRDPSANVTHHANAVYPPNNNPASNGRRTLWMTATVACVSATKISIVVAGTPMWNMRHRFDEAGIGGAYMNAGQPNQQYGRKMQNVDVSVHEGRDKITAMFEVCCLWVSSVAVSEARVNGAS